MNLAELMAGMGQSAIRDEGPKPLPEALCATLREVAATYDRHCPFVPGDLVTPIQACSLRKKGEPHIVLEVRDRPEADFSPCADIADTGTPSYGARRDIRVAAHYGADVAAFWVESWQFEHYRGPGSEAAAA